MHCVQLASVCIPSDANVGEVNAVVAAKSRVADALDLVLSPLFPRRDQPEPDTMKLLSVSIMHVSPGASSSPAIAVASATDLSSFSFYQRGT